MTEPLYIKRNVLNGQDLIDWGRSEGLTSMLAPEELHVTVAFIRDSVAHDSIELRTDELPLVHTTHNYRELVRFGSSMSIKFWSPEIKFRNIEVFNHFGLELPKLPMRPHIALTYTNIPVQFGHMRPFTDVIVLGPEIAEPLNLNWSPKEIAL